MERMIFGATCSPTIAQCVKNVNAKKFAAVSPRVVHAITEGHYVDDYVDCFQTEKEALIVVPEVIRIHRTGGFVLRNIISNSEKLKTACGSSASTAGDVCIEKEADRILGMH
ncbi:PREDICTED: uncharacterized protein LOC108373806 [Rhagoletis zephyria]|uniref:uncharacterized protein LOC108373806 n=1 Tax=Rhagoletis zephyria TaxID=28612 RepID=UPI0008118026|nr:PREDICTED: uncharacterized protein LOC108373806 [Rhagoletis zephyria]